MSKLAPFLAVIALLLGASLASAKVHHKPHHHARITCVSARKARANRRWNKHHRHHRRRITRVCRMHRSKRPDRPVGSAANTAPWYTNQTTPVSVTPAVSLTQGEGGAISNNCASTPEGTVRLILFADEPLDRFYSCAQTAYDNGDRLIISIAFNATLPISQIQQWFSEAIAMYGPFHPMAIGIGNEQEGGWNPGGPESPSSYSQVWKAVEPMIASEAPYALREAGDVSPWSLDWLASAAASGLPGAQVFAGHAYPAGTSGTAHTIAGFDPSQLTMLAHKYGAQAWATEGMCSTGEVWGTYGCRTAAQLKADGITLGIVWRAS